ncbi:FtsX-like permease family protein [Actinoplanes sp. NPDC026623]|uniref:FtsX-like permease family protein n=1 Tax=Actinoplanes sp. NPDC026623 TaxID=3155610 RepID=UPI0033E0DA9C
MTASVLDRPAAPPNGGPAARRAVIRWAWRLLRREWRQQLLVLALITVAVAATVLGAGVATNAPPPAGAGFGTADHLVTLPDRADVAAIAQRFSPVDVIENQPLPTGLAGSAQLRAQDPGGAYGRPMLALVSGRYPSGPAEAAMTAQLAAALGLRVGDIWPGPAGTRRVVGVVENPQNLLDEFALVAPGQLAHPGEVSVLFDAGAADTAGFTFPPGAVPLTPTPPPGVSPEFIVLALAVVGLIFIGLVATAGFTVLAQRRLRALGMLSALGATDRHIRLVMRTNGTLVGGLGALAGAVIGVAAWTVYAPRYSVSVNHRVSWTSLPWWLVTAAMVLAVATATLAARRPARTIARVPVVSALSGRPAPVKATHRSIRLPLALLIAGPVMLFFSGGWGSRSTTQQLLQLGGLAASAAGLMYIAPVVVGMLGAIAGWAPFTSRVALRDLARYRSRSGPALAASSFAVLIAVLVALISTGRFTDSVDYVGPNLPHDQLIVYAPGDDPADHGPSPATPQANTDPKAAAAAIADALGSNDVLALDSVRGGLAQCRGGAQEICGSNGKLYVATPELLSHYGIGPNDIASGTQLLTSRPHLTGLSGLKLVGFALDQFGNGIDNPRIQTTDRLPTGTSQPNLLVTQQAVDALKLEVTSAAAWLIQLPQPLTATQINSARQIAVRSGLTIETSSQQPSLDEVRNYATATGVLLALGVLAMTVGLIRSETAGDLRILAATGARRRTRRTLTAVTAGALGTLAAILGTAVAYLATVAFFRSQLSERMSQPPWLDLLLVVVGLPVAATLGGWLFAAGEPATMAHAPIE